MKYKCVVISSRNIYPQEKRMFLRTGRCRELWYKYRWRRIPLSGWSCVDDGMWLPLRVGFLTRHVTNTQHGRWTYIYIYINVCMNIYIYISTCIKHVSNKAAFNRELMFTMTVVLAFFVFTVVLPYWFYPWNDDGPTTMQKQYCSICYITL